MKSMTSMGLICMAVVFAACGNQQTEQATSSKDNASTMSTDTTTAKTYSASMVDNKKDPTCGMPVTAGIGDTAHYDNHVIGFCSTECKNEFLKNPKAGIAAAELTK